MKQRFCLYGQHFMPDTGFIFKVHPGTGTKRGMCPICQEKRRRPRAELEKLAAQEREERQAAARARFKKEDQ